MSSRDALHRLSEVGRWIDEFSKDRDQVPQCLYVCDTDIVNLYSRPEENFNYCALLRSEREARVDVTLAASKRNAQLVETEQLLADILGNYLIWGRRSPAFTSPAHQEELGGVLTAIFVRAVGQVETVIELLRNEFRELAARGQLPPRADSQQVAPQLAIAVSAALATLQSHGSAVLECLRMMPALKDERIYSVDRHRLSKTHGTSSDSDYLPSALDAETGDFRPEINAVAKDIERLLIVGSAGSSSRREAWRADARALAHLCWLNQQLEGMGSDVRVRLITGAHHLHRLKGADLTWMQRLPPGLSKTLELVRPDLQALIRHPLGFLDDPDIHDLLGLQGYEREGGKFGVWLRDRLTRPVRRDDYADSEFADSAPDETPEDQELLAAAADSLKQLLITARARQSISHDKAWVENLVREVISSRHDEWDNVLGAGIREVLPRFLATLAVLRPHSKVGGHVARNLPPLRFDVFTACQEFCDNLYLQHAGHRVEPQQARSSLERVIRADPTLYTPLLALAMWRAAERDWRRARVMSAAAMEVADRHAKAGVVSTEPELVNGIFGDEAAYLHAVSLRITAGEGSVDSSVLRDLTLAEKTLDRGQDQLHAFQEFQRTRGLLGAKVDLRFASERLSVQLTRRMLHRLARRAVEPVRTEHDLFKAAWDLFGKMREAVPVERSGDYTHEFVLQQLLTTMAQCVLLDRYGVLGTEVYPILAETWSEDEAVKRRVAEVREALTIQCTRLNEPPQGGSPLPVLSALVQAVWLVFDLEVHEPQRAAGIKERRALRDRLSMCLVETQHVASIDELRFNFLGKIAQRRLNVEF